MASLFKTTISQLSAGLRSGATFVAALSAAGLLAQFTNAPPIFVAPVASLAVSGTARALGAEEPFDAGYTSLSQVAVHLISCLAAMAGLWGIVNLVPAVGIFVCEPLVPWHVSIAIFGAFGMSWLAAAAKIRMPHDRVGLMMSWRTARLRKYSAARARRCGDSVEMIKGR